MTDSTVTRRSKFFMQMVFAMVVFIFCVASAPLYLTFVGRVQGEGFINTGVLTENLQVLFVGIVFILGPSIFLVSVLWRAIKHMAEESGEHEIIVRRWFWVSTLVISAASLVAMFGVDWLKDTAFVNEDALSFDAELLVHFGIVQIVFWGAAYFCYRKITCSGSPYFTYPSHRLFARAEPKSEFTRDPVSTTS